MVFVCLFAYNLYKGYWRKHSKKLMESSDKDKHIMSGLETAHFQTEKELAKNFTQIEYDDLKKTNFDGIPIKAEYVKNKLNITFSKPAHTLIIGTTGSGKTTTFINPTAQILAHTKNQPSMLLSDPKGELYSLHSKELKELGYDVKVIDLRNPYLNDVEYCLYFRGVNVCNPKNYDDARTVFKNNVNKIDKHAFHHPTCNYICRSKKIKR